MDDRPAAEPDPEPLWADATLDDVQSALAAIDADLREAFELRYLKGLRYRDIAARLRCRRTRWPVGCFGPAWHFATSCSRRRARRTHGEQSVRTER